jgi:hypothetical protein
MSPLRFREDDESSSTSTVLGVLVGAVAGFAVGMYVAQRVGGFSGLTSKLRRRADGIVDARRRRDLEDEDELEEFEEDELEPEAEDAELEERVLEAFRNDPILCERAVDIGSISEGVIELAGWVETDEEAHHAVTIARGVPGADPKLELEDRWQRTDDAVLNAADDIEGLADRRTRVKRGVRGDRTGGSPIAPSGVPKGDHVAEPLKADRQVVRGESGPELGGTHPE